MRRRSRKARAARRARPGRRTERRSTSVPAARSGPWAAPVARRPHLRTRQRLHRAFGRENDLFLRGGGLWIGARGEEPRAWDLPKEIADESLARGRLSVLGTSIAFSPDCSKVAISPVRMCAAAYPAGEARRLAVADVQAASWMPDSRRLVLTRIPGPESPHAFDARYGHWQSSDVLCQPGGPDVRGRLTRWEASRLRHGPPAVAPHRNRRRGRPNRTLRATFGMSLSPAWAPAGASYLFAVRRGERWGIDTASATEHLSRRVVEVSEGGVNQPQWAPDGSQFTFLWERPAGGQLMLSNTSGRKAPLDPGARGRTADAVWAADGSHVSTRGLTARPSSGARTAGVVGQPRNSRELWAGRGRMPPDSCGPVARGRLAPHAIGRPATGARSRRAGLHA